MKNQKFIILFIILFFYGCAPKVDIEIKQLEKCNFDKYIHIVLYYPNEYQYMKIVNTFDNKNYKYIPYEDLVYISKSLYDYIRKKYPLLSISLVDEYTNTTIDAFINKDIPISNTIYINIIGIIGSYDVLTNYVKLYESYDSVIAKSYVYSETKHNILLHITINGEYSMWNYSKEYLSILLYLDDKYKFKISNWLESFDNIFKQCFNNDLNNSIAYNYIDMAYKEYYNFKFENAKKLYVKACNLKNGFGCYEAAEAYEGDEEYNKALNLYIKACEYDYYKGCGKAGDMYSNYILGKIYPKKAIDLYYKQCRVGNMNGCDSISALILRLDETYKKDKIYGLSLLKKLCDVHKKYCFRLGTLYLSLDAKATSIKYIKKACSNGEYIACKYLDQYLIK